MAERKTIYLDDAIDEIARWIGYLDEDMIYRIQTGLKKLPSTDPEAAIVKVLKMVEEYKEKTGTDEIIIMPKNGMKAWDENGVEYTMQPTCNNLATDTISRKAAIALAKDLCVPTKDGTVYRHRCIDPDAINELPSAQPERDAVEEWNRRAEERKTGQWIKQRDPGSIAIGELSDGFHTLYGLYEQRMILFAALVKAYKDKAWKSYLDEDGEYYYGGGWFTVGIDTPEGSYTYRFENKYWNMFDCADLPRGKHWDGHTEADAKTRLMSLEPEPYTERRKEDDSISD